MTTGYQNVKNLTFFTENSYKTNNEHYYSIQRSE